MKKLILVALMSLGLAGCNSPESKARAVYLLLDTSGTYTAEMNKAQKIINYLLGTLDSGAPLPTDGLFRPERPGTKFDHMLAQGTQIITGNREGGFFLMIGRRRADDGGWADRGEFSNFSHRTLDETAFISPGGDRSMSDQQRSDQQQSGGESKGSAFEAEAARASKNRF